MLQKSQDLKVLTDSYSNIKTSKHQNISFYAIYIYKETNMHIISKQNLGINPQAQFCSVKQE